MSIWSSLLQTGASLASTAGGIYAASQAADAQQDAAQQSTAAQQAMYQQNRADMAPYRAAGYGALDAQSQLLGLGGGLMSDENLARLPESYRAGIRSQQNTLANAAPGSEAYYNALDKMNTWREGMRGLAESGRFGVQTAGDQMTQQLRETPGYEFRMNEGVEARDRSAAARGMALSGAHQKALTEFGQGLADKTYGQRLNRLAGLAGTGQTATTNTAQMGTQLGQQIGQNALAAGNARASSYGAMARQGNQLLNNLDYTWG